MSILLHGLLLSQTMNELDVSYYVLLFLAPFTLFEFMFIDARVN
jgi:hypothetical protein